MSAVVTSHETEHEVHPDAFFWKIGVVLALLTALEVTTIWWEDWFALDATIVSVSLIAMMVVKFLLVVGFFMHLRFDDKILGRIFFVGLSGALVVMLAYTASMRIFEDNSNVIIKDPPIGRDQPPPPTDPPPIIIDHGHE